MLIGESAAIHNIQTLIDQVHKDSRMPVLVTGETGVGKELVAQAIHFGGPRASKLFVPVNCGAIPSTLSESAFFGHLRGAFTGALTDHKGYFESADGGTLFLDEIGDMPFEDQIKLLRVLDGDAITPVGATEGKKVDIRVVAATNADILAKADAGLFRRDLYYRLAGMTIWIPPLYERKEDIPLIAEYYLSESAARLGISPPSLTPEAKMALEGYAFPGNVRELIHIIEFAVMMSDGEAIQPKHLRFPPAPADVLTPPTTGIDEASPSNATDFVAHLGDETEMSEDTFLPLEDALARYEQQYLCHALERAGGNRAEAARLLNLPQRTFYRKLAKYDL